MEPESHSGQVNRIPVDQSVQPRGTPTSPASGIDPDALAKAWMKQSPLSHNPATAKLPYATSTGLHTGPLGAIPAQPGKRAWQFSMGTLHVLLFIAAMTFAAWAGLMQDPAANEGFPFWILLPVIFPLGLFMLLGVVKKGVALYRNWRTEQSWYAEQQAKSPWSEGPTSLEPKQQPPQ